MPRGPPPSDLLATFFANARRRWREGNGLVEAPPTVADAEAIIAFAAQRRGVDGVVLFHCTAGINRSPAAAVICLAVWLGDEVEAATHLSAVRPIAVPHAGLVQFADDLLGSRGRLAAAARPVPRQ